MKQIFNQLKKTLVLFAVSFSLLTALSVRADEGMWLPFLVERLNYTDMQKSGLKLTADEIYSANHASLKDAIVLFGRGCTGEIISDQGLILTNHHCGYGAIQSVSDVANDYLTNGFWATKLQEELPIEGLSVQFLDHFEDVTAKMLDGITPETPETDRNKLINERREKLVKEATEGTKFNAVVKEFYNGNEFYLFVYLTYNDVRLVGTPPSAIGKFGADTDNWMWPRHTGDFSIFRVYGDKDGNPNVYKKINVPLKPKHFLPINIGGVKEGDFAMIMGFPGRTDRYLASEGVKMAIDQSNPTIVDIRRKKLDIMSADMQADAAVRIKYASKYAGIANYWKYFIGQTKGLKRLKVADKKKALEDEFAAWVAADASRTQLYGNVLPSFKAAYDELRNTNEAGIYYREAAFGPEIMGFALRFEELKELISAKKPDKEKLNELQISAKEKFEAYFKNYNPSTDQKLLAAMLNLFYKKVPSDQQPEYFKELAIKYKGDFDKFAAEVFAKSVFRNLEAAVEFVRNPKASVFEKEKIYLLAKAFQAKAAEITKAADPANEKLKIARRLFVAGLRQMQTNRTFYPDANQTMRLTYGQVKDYTGADAVLYSYFTTQHGILEKEDPNNYEFVVPQRLKELIQKKDFGPYAEDDTLHVCFLTTHDITGGNSGSPVINAKGELIGLAFDGNWEAMSGDIAYEPELQRTINVDARYVLFIIDKFAKSDYILKELKLVGKQ